jgi:hypothetical protein
MVCLCFAQAAVSRTIFQKFIKLNFLSISQKFTRNYSPQKLEECSQDQPIILNLKIPENNFNDTVELSGSVEVRKKINGPLDASGETNRCSLDMKTCEKFGTFNIPEGCKKFKDPKTFYANLMDNFEPRPSCPVLPGNYTIRKTIVDLKAFRFVPLDGYIYNIIAKGTGVDSATKTKITALCTKVEVKVVKVRI